MELVFEVPAGLMICSVAKRGLLGKTNMERRAAAIMAHNGLSPDDYYIYLKKTELPIETDYRDAWEFNPKKDGIIVNKTRSLGIAKDRAIDALKRHNIRMLKQLWHAKPRKMTKKEREVNRRYKVYIALGEDIPYLELITEGLNSK